EASEQAQIDLKNKIKESAKVLDMEVDFIESTDLSASDTEKFNELNILNDWLSEKLTHADSELEVMNSTQEEMEMLAQKYGSDIFMWMGIAALKEKEESIALRVAIACLFWPAAPFIIADLVSPEYATYFFTLVADGESGDLIMQYYNGTEMKDVESVQKSNIHYILHQIKKEKK
ncbi:MAG: hypothetical protein H7X71_03205, partial [Chitinophagales bacterium]|nr:hypothetical protein [Chitinophagales bacterium]